MKREIEICIHALNMLFERNNTRYVKSVGRIHIFTADDKNMDACKFKKRRIIWRVEKSELIKGHGRWRNDKNDEKILFNIVGDSAGISIVERSGTRKEIFKLKT